MLWYNITRNDRLHSLKFTVVGPTLSRRRHCIVPAAVLCSKGQPHSNSGLLHLALRSVNAVPDFD